MDAAAGKITEQVMGILFKFIGRHIGYVVSYKKHIRSLEDEAERLEEVKLRIRGMVDEARSNAEVIDRGVERWLEEVQQKQDEVVELLEGKEKVSCLSVGSCYRLGRRGCQKKEDVIGLKQRGDGFVEGGSVGRPARLTDIWYTHASDYQHFDSRDFIFKEIMDALQDDSKYLIGIHGMPGVGKTRLADEVAKQAKEDKLFEEIAKATVSQTLDWEAIQRELAECLNLQLRKESRAGRAGELRNRLKNGEKILLILDDVWSQINLKEIGIPFNDQTKGCKILLTSRRQDVCIQMGVEKVFRLGVLREDEAWSLLKKKVGDSIDTPEMQLLAKEVCKECGGLPLAILAVGGALMGADKHAWKDALYQLRNSRGNDIDGIEAEVYTPIELSYKYLKRADAQSCFLHCSLFREDAEISIDDLLRYGVGTRFLESINKMEEARDRVHALVGTLKRSSLLLQGRNENFVKMHDIIRDVAISIASKDEQYAFLVKNGVQRWLDNEKYECCMAISLRSNAICELPDKLKCPKLRTLVLVHEMERYGDPLLKVPNNFFKWMEKLEVLHLTRLHISTLTSSLRNLINLRMLCLNSCKLVSASLINELDKLEILSLENCDIDESPNLRTDFDFVEPAIEAVKFIHLRILDFNSNRGLRLPSGSISNLPLLEELYIYHFDGWEVEGSVSLLELNYLAGLSSLAIHLQDVMLLPKDLHFNSLNRFKISIGSRIDYSDYGYNSSIARALKLKGIPLKAGFNVLMERVQALSFIEINGLEKVLLNTDFPDLEYLKVDRCSGTEHLLGKAKSNSQTVSASLDKLRVLKVSNCTMKYLFFGSNAKGIQQLQQLHVQNCDRMEAITGERDTERAMDTIIFNQLKDLKLKYLPKLKSVCANMRQMSNTEFNTSTGTTLTLFNEKISFPALEELNIKRLDNITVILAKQLSRIWTEASQAQPCSFNKLRALTVSENCKLKYLFSPSIARFLQNQLQQLKIKGCDSIEAIIGNDEEEVTDNITFHQLKDLKLLNLPSLRSIYAVNTEEISSIECNPSTIAPPLVNAKSFPALETLTIEKLDSIPVIFEKQLLLIGMEESHAELCSFSKLSDLTVNGNCKLKYLFSPCIATWLPQLKQLHVEDCENMEALIGIGEDEEEIVGDIIFCQLKRLMLVDLPNLKSISANTRKVTSPTTALSLFNAKVCCPGSTSPMLH